MTSKNDEPRARAEKPEKVTAPKIAAMKGAKKIVALTAYDYPTARLVDEAGLDFVLVGDSASNVVLGNDSTLPMTLDAMLLLSQAVVKGCARALVVGDLPFGSYHASTRQAVRSSIRFVKEAGVGAVKLEGGIERAEAVKAIVEAGIPVMGHVGLRPQALLAMGGYKVQGRGDAAAARMIEDAQAIAQAGAFAVVLEAIPAPLAAQITRELRVPTIGIGAGGECDGQILVLHDLIGLSFGKRAKFVRPYADVAAVLRDAFARFKDDVASGAFPSESETYR